MLIYEYECRKCSLRFELTREFSENGSGFCPQCDNEARRLFSPVPVIFKGPGFYATDNRKDHGRVLDEGEADKLDADRKRAE